MSPLPKRKYSTQRLRAWQDLRKYERHGAVDEIDRKHAAHGKELVALYRSGALWSVEPRERIRWPKKARCRWTVPFAKLVLQQIRDRGARALVITLDELATLLECHKNSAQNAVDEADELGLVARHPWHNERCDRCGHVDHRHQRTSETGSTACADCNCEPYVEPSGARGSHLRAANHYTLGPTTLIEIGVRTQTRGERALRAEQEVNRLRKRDSLGKSCGKTSKTKTEQNQAPTSDQSLESQDHNRCDPTDQSEALKCTVDARAREPVAVKERRPAAADHRRARKRRNLDALCARTLARADWLQELERWRLQQERPSAAVSDRAPTAPQRGTESPVDATTARAEIAPAAPREPTVERNELAEGDDGPPSPRATDAPTLRDEHRWSSTPKALLRELYLRWGANADGDDDGGG